MFAVSTVEECRCECCCCATIVLAYIRRRSSEENQTEQCVTTTTRLPFRSNDLSILLEEVWVPFTNDDPVETDAHLSSMHLIIVRAFPARESLIRKEKRVERP